MGMQRHQSTPAPGGVDPGRAAPQKGQSTQAAPPSRAPDKPCVQ